MSLLKIVQAVGLDVGIFGQSVPTSFIGTAGRDNAELLSFINATAEEVARRVDWGSLRKESLLTGTGVAAPINFPSDYSRLIKGSGLVYISTPIRRGLSHDEWSALIPVQGAPRFAKTTFRDVSFYPFLAIGDTVKLTYQSKNWNTSKDVFEADSDVPLIPEIPIIKGTQARWRRQKGMMYESHAAEYEQALKDYAEFEASPRTP